MNSGESTARGFLIGVCTVVVPLVILFTASVDIQRNKGVLQVQQEAIKAGVAEYKPGDEGEPVFTWKVP